MKNKIRLIALALLLASIAFFVVSCNDDKKHNHTYSSNWSFDEVYHWHSAECRADIECLYMVSQLSEHNMLDGACSVCGYSIPSDEGNNDSGNIDGEANDNPPAADDTNNGGENTDSDGNGNTEPNPDSGNGEGSDDGDDKDDPTCNEHQYICQTVSEPTCTTRGENVYTCSICADSYTESVDPLGHDEVTIPATEPTCTETGLSRGKQCAVCGEITKAQTVISALGHNYLEGNCLTCGNVDPDYTPPNPNAIYTATTNTYCWVDKVSYTAIEGGEYTFTLPANLGAWSVNSSDSNSHGPEVDSLHSNYVSRESKFTVYIYAGETYEFYIASSISREWVIYWSFNPCDPPVEPEIPDEPIDISGTYYGTDAFGNQLLNLVIDSAAGTVVFNYYHHLTGPNSVNATYTVTDGVVSLFDEEGKPLHPLSGTLTLVGGIPAYASYNATEYALSTEVPDGGMGGDSGEIKVIRGIMTDGEENTFTITDDDLAIDKMYVKFNPANSGVYDFNGVHIFVSSITTEDGTPAEKNVRELYILESGVTYILEITLEFVAHTGDYTITPVYQYPEGHSKNPIWYTLGEDVVATYHGDYRPVWYQFYADKTGMLTVTSTTQGVTILMAAVSNFDIEAEQRTTMGVVQGRKYFIGIIAYGIESDVEIQFTASITKGEITTEGSVNSPHDISLGYNTKPINGSSGMYFIYKSDRNGVLTLFGANGFSWCITDFTDRENTAIDDISVHLFVGDIIYLYVEPDESTTAISFDASFVEDPEQTLYAGPFVIDGSSANEFVIEKNTYGFFRITGTVGRFIFNWDNPNAILTLNGLTINNGDTVEIADAWFSPFFEIYLTDYAAGIINLTITPVVDKQ